MTCALSLLLWMAAAQTSGESATQSAPAAAPPAAPATVPAAPSATAPATVPAAVVVQCPPSDAEALQAQLDEARGQLDEAVRDAAEAKQQLAELKDKANMPDHAVAALLVSDHPGLARLERVGRKAAPGSGMWRVRPVQAEVYVSRQRGETMVAVVLTTRNPREMPTWEPTEASIMEPSYRGAPPVPVAIRSSPERIRPGETARIALVFNLADVEWYDDYIHLVLFRNGKWEMETELRPSDFQVGSANSRGNQ